MTRLPSNLILLAALHPLSSPLTPHPFPFKLEEPCRTGVHGAGPYTLHNPYLALFRNNVPLKYCGIFVRCQLHFPSGAI
ncbi:hypothetical protein DPMN_049600 [Dreissena polymorpha]|uniref:Secreted protein n=1 Tax=Dreissena polymorpha TaxID=45954 RepID=A0A9D4HM96_DREPO|nr:hypothetical protein DPMN_049600 [Dreissena polymorpha]